MFNKGISKDTRRSLALLGKAPWIKKFYLAGGTACALRLGHRLSFDLDFFTRADFSQKDLQKWFAQQGDFRLDQIKKNTLLGVFEQTKVSFFKYDYPLLAKTDLFEGAAILRNSDLMAMKVDAISTRGTKRDFVDLYFLTKKTSLLKAINAYRKKYADQDLNLVHTLRSLAYFSDAEKEEMPQILVACDWKKVKRFFLKEAPRVLDKLIE